MNRSSKTLHEAIKANSTSTLGVFRHSTDRGNSYDRTETTQLPVRLKIENYFISDTIRKIDVLLKQPYFQNHKHLIALKEFLYQISNVTIINESHYLLLKEYNNSKKHMSALLLQIYNTSANHLQQRNVSAYALLMNAKFAEGIADMAPTDTCLAKKCVNNSCLSIVSTLWIGGIIFINILLISACLQRYAFLNSLISLIKSCPLTVTIMITATLFVIGVTASLITFFAHKNIHTQALASLKSELILCNVPIAEYADKVEENLPAMNSTCVPVAVIADSAYTLSRSSAILVGEPVSLGPAQENIPQTSF